MNSYPLILETSFEAVILCKFSSESWRLHSKLLYFVNFHLNLGDFIRSGYFSLNLGDFIRANLETSFEAVILCKFSSESWRLHSKLLYFVNFHLNLGDFIRSGYFSLNLGDFIRANLETSFEAVILCKFLSESWRLHSKLLYLVNFHLNLGDFIRSYYALSIFTLILETSFEAVILCQF